jgi:molybdenum cofactor guanylyltransferase
LQFYSLYKSMVPRKQKMTVEIYILAGGLSSRMGRDKSRIRIGRRSMLGHIRTSALQLGLPVRVLRRDTVPRCGPLGGIYTALSRSRADAILFLACDMPFVTRTFLKQMLRLHSVRNAAIFSSHTRVRGLPCLLPREITLPIVARQIVRSQLSLQSLARALKAKTLRPARNPGRQLLNLNTPADFQTACRLFRVVR